MSNQKGCLLGCGAAALVAFVLMAFVLGWFMYVGQEIKDISVSIDLPTELTIGETFVMTVNISNQRQGLVLALSDIDIHNDFLDGFLVITTDPATKSSMMVPFVNFASYTFDQPVSAGTTQAFTFTLRAEKAGIFRGAVHICEGARILSTLVQTAVKD